MNLLLSIGDWFAQNWMLLLMVVVLGGFVVMTFLKQKKENDAKNDLVSTIKKGTKIVTTAGVYGVVESIEETTDGKVVVISTGSYNNPSSMTIHINAIMGIDNKTSLKEEKKSKKVVEIIEEVDDEDTTDDEYEEIEVVEKKVSKKSNNKSSK